MTDLISESYLRYNGFSLINSTNVWILIISIQNTTGQRLILWPVIHFLFCCTSKAAISDNEGHIFVKLTNDTNEGKTVSVAQGTGMVQGIFMQYGVTIDDDILRIC